MKKHTVKNKSTLIAYIILFVIIFLPLFIGHSEVPLTEAEEGLYGSTSYNDMFAKSKGVVLMSLSVVALLSIAGDYITAKKRKVRFSIPILLILGYGVLIIISTLLSEHKIEAVRGVLDRYEGVWVLLSYLVIFISSYMVSKKGSMPNIKWLLVLSSSVVSIIGWVQLFGYNLLNSEFALRLIFMWKYKHLEVMPFFDSDQAYSTFGNPNFVGSYLALVIPYFFVQIMSFEYEKGNRKSLVELCVLSTAFVLNVGFLIASRSLAGYVGIMFAVFFAMVCFSGLKFKLKKIAYPGLLFLITGVVIELLSTTKSFQLEVYVAILASIIGALLIGVILKRINTKKRIISALMFIVLMSSALISWVAFGEWDRYKFVDSGKMYFESIEINTNEITFDYMLDGKRNLTVGKDGNGYFYTLDNNKYHYQPVDDVYRILDNDSMSTFEFKLLPREGYEIILFENYKMGFILLENSFSMISSGKYAVEIDDPEIFGIKGLEHLGSGRAYIWSRSIPLIKDTLLFGVGPDVYLHKFPQNDLVGKINLGNSRLVIDKPHNWYLQVAINTGFISLIIILALFLIAMKALLSEKDYGAETTMVYSYGVAILAYHVTALFNDSVVMTAPIFWAFYGLLFGLLSKRCDFSVKKIWTKRIN